MFDTRIRDTQETYNYNSIICKAEQYTGCNFQSIKRTSIRTRFADPSNDDRRPHHPCQQFSLKIAKVNGWRVKKEGLSISTDLSIAVVSRVIDVVHREAKGSRRKSKPSHSFSRNAKDRKRQRPGRGQGFSQSRCAPIPRCLEINWIN